MNLRKVWRKLNGLLPPMAGEPSPVTRRLDRQLQAQAARPSAELVAWRIPGPATPRAALEAGASDGLALSDELAIGRDGKRRGAVRISADDLAAAADTCADGTVSFIVSGKAKQGEDGSLRVCQSLRERLNEDGAKWSEPETLQREEGVDGVLRSGRDELKIQVTRAQGHREFWKDLKRSTSVRGQLSSDDAADELRAAIEQKQTRAGRDIVLALNAIDTPVYTLGDVVSSFRRRHGPWAAGAGFKEVWVVGRTADLTERLDSGSPV